MKKVCVVLTTRGNYAKFKRLLHLLDEDKDIELQCVVGGELLLSDRVTSFFDIRDNAYKVYFNVAGDNLFAMGKSHAMAISEFSGAFRALKPDIVMLVGDRFETHGAATAAYIRGIPIAHLEGGEVSGTLDDGFRNAISSLSTIHFPCTEKAGIRLWNLSGYNSHTVGSTSIDAMLDVSLDYPLSNYDFFKVQKDSGSGGKIDIDNPFLLVIWHPDTLNLDNVPRETERLIDVIDQLRMPTIWMNANLDAGNDIIGSLLRNYRDKRKPEFIHFFKSLPIEYFGTLLRNATCIVGNSSAGVREASYFGTPNVTIGDRQKGREIGQNTIRTDYLSILDPINKQIEHGPYESDTLYGDGTASDKIMEVIKCT